MKNKIKKIGIIAFLTIILFSFASCDNGTTNGGNIRETKNITVTILNENESTITAVSILTIAVTGTGGDFLVGSPINGVSVNIPQNETYTSPLITVRRWDTGPWMLAVYVNNISQSSSQNMLSTESPPEILALKYTSEGQIIRID